MPRYYTVQKIECWEHVLRNRLGPTTEQIAFDFLFSMQIYRALS